jgi:hypothetical protein
MKFTYNSDNGIAVVDGVAVKVATPSPAATFERWLGTAKRERLNILTARKERSTT